jgi:hypothetical protein
MSTPALGVISNLSALRTGVSSEKCIHVAVKKKELH